MIALQQLLKDEEFAKSAIFVDVSAIERRISSFFFPRRVRNTIPAINQPPRPESIGGNERDRPCAPPMHQISPSIMPVTFVSVSFKLIFPCPF